MRLAPLLQSRSRWGSYGMTTYIELSRTTEKRTGVVTGVTIPYTLQQLVAPGAANFPAAQGNPWQVVEALTALYLPGSQAAHEVNICDSPLPIPEYVPAAQSMQLDLPLPGWY